MSISDEDLVRQLESVPLVESPDFREPVLRQLRVEDSGPPLSGQPRAAVLHFKPRLYLGLAWAAAIALVLGVALQRAFEQPRPENAAATIAPADLTVHRIGDRWAVQANVKGEIQWDRAKLSKVDTLPDGTVILRRNPGASGPAEIRLRVAGREVLKMSIVVD